MRAGSWRFLGAYSAPRRWVGRPFPGRRGEGARLGCGRVGMRTALPPTGWFHLERRQREREGRGGAGRRKSGRRRGTQEGGAPVRGRGCRVGTLEGREPLSGRPSGSHHPEGATGAPLHSFRGLSAPPRGSS